MDQHYVDQIIDTAQWRGEEQKRKESNKDFNYYFTVINRTYLFRFKIGIYKD